MATLFQFPYRTVAEISISALVKNVSTLRSLCRREIIPVVKADAYGHGMVAVSKALVSRGCCDMLAVATLEEGIELRKKLVSGVEILVLSGFLPHQWDAYLKFRLTPMIHSLNHLKSLSGKKELPRIHLKVDTGMHRLGLQRDELEPAIRLLKKFPDKLAGLASHLAESENGLSNFTDLQLAEFAKIHQAFLAEKVLQTDARIHVSNSGGILRNKLGIATAVRPGLSVYGLSPHPRNQLNEHLVPALQWKTRILSLKTVKRGETVGYNRTYQAKKKERIAVIPIGYADGYPRLLSNRGFVLSEGKRLPIRGIVSMDMTMIDCGALDNPREGALVTLIGNSGKESISAWDIAGWADTIAYEIFCGLSPRVPRVYLD